MKHDAFDTKLPRLMVEQRLLTGQSLTLPDEQAHYLRSVLRRPDGAALRVFNSGDGEWMARLSHDGKRGAIITPETLIRKAEPSPPRRHLIFSPLKKDNLDILIEKSVELGATDLRPVLFQRSVVRDINTERLTAQIREATEQCERLDTVTLSPLTPLTTLLKNWETHTPLYAAIERLEAAPLLRDISLDRAQQNGFLLGPEGGLTDEEKDHLQKMAFVIPVSLGPRILRAETAALYGLAYLG